MSRGLSSGNSKMEIKLQNKQGIVVIEAQDLAQKAKADFLVGSGSLGLSFFIKRRSFMDLEKHEELLEDARRQYPDMILDGAINNDYWSKEKIRILWVVKETSEFPKGNDLRSLLRQVSDSSEPDKIYSNWELAYALPIKVSHEFIESEKRINKLVDKRSILNHVAIIALNKSVGASKSSHSELLEAAGKFRELVLKQIDSLDPNIVILADTFPYLFERGKTWK